MAGGAGLVAIGLALVMLTWIGLLPRIFFRPGRRNFQWWLNTVPFWVAGVTVLAVGVGVTSAHQLPGVSDGLLLPLLSSLASLMAMLLLGLTIATHERPLALWHQKDDGPEHLVTTGPYGRVRHPLYTSFLLALAGCLLAAPHGLTGLALIGGVYRLNRTAAAEEARFLHSDFTTEYADYMSRTGRFLPSFRS